jgi:hypothetical protein
MFTVVIRKDAKVVGWSNESDDDGREVRIRKVLASHTWSLV